MDKERMTNEKSDIRHSSFGRGRASLLLLVVGFFRRAFAELLPILQFAVHGFVATGHNLLAFAQAFGDLPIIAVADADLHRDRLDVIAFNDKDNLPGLRW